MVERSLSMREVRGSIPRISILFFLINLALFTGLSGPVSGPTNSVNLGILCCHTERRRVQEEGLCVQSFNMRNLSELPDDILVRFCHCFQQKRLQQQAFCQKDGLLFGNNKMLFM
ncbi:Uncharacterized protein Rs2_15170 [Raphanus sativus]|nr:Uncharacterized protein Rs2_15170 [Raphanus sativus]